MFWVRRGAVAYLADISLDRFDWAFFLVSHICMHSIWGQANIIQYFGLSDDTFRIRLWEI